MFDTLFRAAVVVGLVSHAEQHGVRSALSIVVTAVVLVTVASVVLLSLTLGGLWLVTVL